MDLHLGMPFETVTLTALGNRRETFFEILEEGVLIYRFALILYYGLRSSSIWTLCTDSSTIGVNQK